MRFLLGALFVFAAAAPSGSAALQAVARPEDDGAPAPQPSPSPSSSRDPAQVQAPSPSPTPRFKLIPYGFETEAERSYVPLLRFEDRAEIRALEMNAAIARFFDNRDDRGNMLRGATPGGAPTLTEMANYRPHVSPSLDLLGAVLAVAKGVRHQVSQRRGRLLPAPTPEPSVSPTPTLAAGVASSPSPTPSPTPTPTPRPLSGPPARKIPY